ncbi:uncharacterized protein LOC129807661 isoform X2 [Phlebotomus papatasi]|uniref:DUF4806 domain-containing protein n=1 Tax=Phlebotomus papatasi TaxID=29031 RepID=A0A1B0GQ91_PHLPP|nr:uncharacterized protein LOC129807661 isoform X2 [Phlebotomus papatasi]
MSSQRKVLKRENLNYIDLLQQTIEHSEGQGDPLSEQIIEEDMGVDEYENEKKVDLDSFEVSVDNQYEISADARTGAKGDDSDDEIRIVLKRKKPRGSGSTSDSNQLNDIYMLLLSMDKRISSIERWLKSTNTNPVVVSNTSMVTRFLPMKTVQELKDFDEMLSEADFEVAFVNFVQNAELKDMMDDNLIINFNYSGVHRKLALKNFKFIQVWKDNSNLPETEFAKNLKIEIGAAHNRHHSRQARLRKSNTGT